jgi:RHS repeat-associated protein
MSSKKFAPSGTTQSSKQTGNWTDANSWLSGILPTLADNVTINTGQVLTIPAGEKAFAGTLNDKGTLRNFGTLNMGKTTTADLYSENYSWHIRGGLRGKNLDANGDLTNTLFSYKLAYEEGANGYFDGNIRNQYWKSSIDGVQRAFEYSYDKASRLISASYGRSPQASENYALNSVSYDLNGNIKTLSRNGAINSNLTSFGNVDNLTYTYQSNSNKLLKIGDATTNNADLGDFRDGGNTSDDYEYWEDGSLKRDRNKGIDSLKYNYLKLIERVKFTSGRAINYEYDAGGTKLKKVDSNGETTDYEEDDIYVNGVIYQTSHDEGRINAQGEYEYNINDHLGNLRVAFRDSSGVAVPTQSIFYDSWGLSMKGMQVTRNTLNFNKFQYNGKETQFETGFIDLGNRMVNPTTGRMLSIDRFSEKYEHLSPFHFTANNPITHIDMNGDSLALFKNGVYVSMVDNGKKEITGFNQVSTTGKDGKESFTGGQSFSFNDYPDDMGGIKSGELKLRVVSNDEIKNTLIETGITDETSRDSPWSYMERESRPIGDKSLLSCTSTGCMDYQNVTNKNFNSLNIVEGVAYNNADYGNFLWGQAGKQLGFSLNTLTTGAHLNNAVNSRRNNPSQPYGFFDSDGDQRAIKHGHKYNVGKINILKR